MTESAYCVQFAGGCYLKCLPPLGDFRLKSKFCLQKKTKQKKQCSLYLKAVFPHCNAARVQCFDLCVVCVGMFFSSAWSSWQVWRQIRAGFLLAGVKGSSFPPKQTAIWELKLFTGQVAHVFMSTCGKRVTLKWKMELFTQSSLWTEQLQESPVCAAVAPIALDVLWLVPLTVPTLLSFSQHDSQNTVSGYSDHVYPSFTLSPGIY